MYKNGTFIINDPKIRFIFDIRPNFTDINNLIKPLIIFNKEENNE